jgi:hypothetical protein
VRNLNPRLPFLSLIESALHAEGRTLPPAFVAMKANDDVDATVSQEVPLDLLAFTRVPDAETFHRVGPQAETTPMFRRKVVVGVLLDHGAPAPGEPAVSPEAAGARRAANHAGALALLESEIEKLQKERPRHDGADGAMKRKGHDLFLAAVEDFRAGRAAPARMNATLALLYDRDNWVYKLAAELWGREAQR